MIENVGSLSESMVRKLAKDLSIAIKEIHKNSRFYEGHLTMSQILLDREGTLKLSLGLSNNQFLSVPTNKQNEKITIPLSFTQLFINNPSYNQKLHHDNGMTKRIQANDLYNIGLICLSAILGDLDFMGLGEGEVDKINSIVKKTFENKHENLCCLIHSESSIYKKGEKYLTFLDILHKRKVSNEFINFLCRLLRFAPEERSFDEAFLNKKRENGELGIKDLIKVAFFNENSQEEIGSKMGFLEKIIESLKVVLPNCEKWLTKEDYKPYLNHLLPFDEENEVFKKLEKEFGIKRKIIFEKINQVFKSLGFLF